MRDELKSMKTAPVISTQQNVTAVAPFDPVRLLDVELSQPLSGITSYDEQRACYYHRAQVLVRLHTIPLGVVDVPLDNDGVDRRTLAALIWQNLHKEINAHLRLDALSEVTSIDELDTSSTATPRCLQQRKQALTHAPLVSVVVCTRDRTDQLIDALKALMALEYHSFEVIIVDNAPKTSATADLVRTYATQIPEVRYVREDRPGLSRARNCGLQHARGEIVAYTDDDALVDRFWLAAIVSAFQAAPDVACVTGITLPAEIETQAQDWFEQFGGHSKGRGFQREILNIKKNLKHPLYPVPAYGAGVNMAFRKAALQEIGGFDVALGAGTITFGAEDSAAFAAVLVRGYTLVYDSAALVRHYHRRDYEGLSKQLYGYGVAVTAYLIKWPLEDFRKIIDILKLAPRALSYFFSPKSKRTSRMKEDYPREFSRLQIKGLIYGPIAYLISKRRNSSPM
jgi:glycosyltransferase involved in cell wall biosynthesis